MNVAPHEVRYPFLENGGEMGLLTREFDWSSTPLGEPGNWPQSLKTIVSVVLNSRFPMFIWWGDALIQFYNDAYRPSLGNNGKHPAALGQRGEECWPEIWPLIKPLIDQVRRDGVSTWHEDQLIPIYRNGKLEDVYWTFSYSPVKDDNGKHGGVLVVCVETTGKVINHQALIESEDQLRFAIDATELGTWDYNPFTNKFTANQRLKNWFGLPPLHDTDLGDAISAIIPGDRDRVSAAITRALEYDSGGFYDAEFTIVHPQTLTEAIVRARGRAWFNEEKVAYRFNGTLQDVTDQVHSRKKLELEEERTRLAVEAADLGMFMLDCVTNNLERSKRLNEIFGVAENSTQPDFLQVFHPDDLAIRGAAHETAYQTGVLKYEARIVVNNNAIRWIKVNGKLYKDTNGNPLKMMGLVQDITEQKEMEQHKDNFIKLVSHELKTPLTSMLGYAEMLTEKFSLAKDNESALLLNRLKNQVLKLNYIVQDLLDVTRVEGDKIKFREESFNLGELITQIAGEIQAINPSHCISVITAANAVIYADKERVSQVITNLITNAIKYSPESPDIRILCNINNHEVTCAVQDFGIGIAPENFTKIFELFFQEHHESRRYPGLGIGLYLSAEIIKRQHGKIWVESELEKGTTISFSLPAHQ
jgi:PAS domain S-box-containing protein